VLSGVEKLTSACATQVVAVSASLRRVYLEQNLAHPRKVIVLGHGSSKGVDSDRFRPARKSEEIGLRALAKEIGLLPGVPVVGLFGRHAQDKGFEVLFGALTDLNRAGVGYQILAIGDDESHGSFAKPLEVAKYRVISIPRVDDLQRYFRLIDILCLPTLREGLPNIALEAQASGVPVITTDATGAVDAVEDQFCGIVVKKGSASDLASGLKLLLGDASYRAKLANNARPWVLARFGSATVISNNLAYYTQLE
jgi:glycosyltransferase involved in cell wall biosynthesis